MHVVLVGGDGDGDRVEVADGTLELRRAVPEKVPLGRAHPSLVRPSSARIETYRLFPMSPQTLEVIFALEGLTPKQVLSRLIDGYGRT